MQEAGAIISSDRSYITRPRRLRKLYKSEQRTPLRVNRMRHRAVSARFVGSVLVTRNSTRGSFSDRPMDMEIWPGYQPRPSDCPVFA
jgi:hypothetical protein